MATQKGDVAKKLLVNAPNIPIGSGEGGGLVRGLPSAVMERKGRPQTEGGRRCPESPR